MARCAGCAGGGGCSCVVDGVTITGTGVLGDPFVAAGGGGSGGPPLEGTYYVAAVDSRPQVKAMADFVCDGVADEVQINAALNAAATHGFGTVSLSEGNFTLADSIVIPDNNNIGPLLYLNLRGAGFGGGDYNGPESPTILNRPLAMTTPIITDNQFSYYFITGLTFITTLGTLDKQADIEITNRGITIVEHCYFTSNGGSYLARAIDASSGRTTLKVRNNSFRLISGACITQPFAYQTEITGNYFYSSNSDSGAFGANEYVIVLSGQNPPVPEEEADWPCIISNNFSDGNVRGTVSVSGVAQGIIANNVFMFDNEPTILIDKCFEMQIINNQLGGTDGNVIQATESTYLQINNNQIPEPGKHGIALSNCNDCQINNNSIVAGFEASSAAIFLDADSNTNMVTGNQVRGTSLYGIRINSADCDDNWVTNNDLKNAATTPFSDAGTGTDVTAGNRF